MKLFLVYFSNQTVRFLRKVTEDEHENKEEKTFIGFLHNYFLIKNTLMIEMRTTV